MADAATTAAPRTAPATAVPGTLAHALMRQPGFSARVIATGRSAVYVQDAAGEILWLAPAGGVRHRRAVVLSGTLPAPAVGSPVHVRAGCLVVDGTAICDVDRATVWPGSPARLEAAGDRLAGRVCLAARLAQRHTLDAPLLAVACGCWLGEPPPAEPPEALGPFVGRAMAALVETARALRREPWAPLPGVVDALIGLGPGLTPAGDDLLGGLLFALACCGRDCGGLIRPDERRTHPISLAILRDLALGHAPEPLQRLAGELCDPHGGATRETVAAVAAIGHTSGRDLLAGFLVGLCAPRLWPLDGAQSPVYRHASARARRQGAAHG